jgi:hypothetical protein
MMNDECRMQGRSSRARSAFCILHSAFIILIASASVCAAEIIDRVLAVAAGQLIMLSDVTAARDLGLVQAGSAADPIESILSALVDRELILAEVDRYAPPEPGADAVDAAVQNVRARLASPEAFTLAMARSGLDEQHVRETLRQDLRIQAYKDQRFTVPPPTDDELGPYYRDHPQAFTRAGQLVPFDAARPDVVRAFVDGRRAALIADWVAGLRRRAEVLDLYRVGK